MLLAELEHDATYSVFMQALTLFGGAQAVILGLVAFLGKIWVDRQLLTEKQTHEIALKNLSGEIERMSQVHEAKLGHAVYVGKTQYDLELIKHCGLPLWTATNCFEHFTL